MRREGGGGARTVRGRRRRRPTTAHARFILVDTRGRRGSERPNLAEVEGALAVACAVVDSVAVVAQLIALGLCRLQSLECLGVLVVVAVPLRQLHPDCILRQEFVTGAARV